MTIERACMLKEQIRNKGKTIKQFAEEIGIAESTFYRKVERSGGGFTVSEAQRIGEVLALTKDQLVAIFF